jgi:hypothetical protein
VHSDLECSFATAACRRSDGAGGFVALRAGHLWHVIAGEIAVVRPRKQWRYAGAPCLSGAIESTRIDAAALGLIPLKLEDQGIWAPWVPRATAATRVRLAPSLPQLIENKHG